MSRLSRKQVQQPAPHYAAVPQSPTRVNPQPGTTQPYIGGPRPQSSSGSGSNHRSKQQNERSTIAMGVATGNIGAGYGPYSVRYFFIIQIGNLADYRQVSSATSSRSCKPYEFSV
jgi:beta-glucan synthesis-associated protein KRE6